MKKSIAEIKTVLPKIEDEESDFVVEYSVSSLSDSLVLYPGEQAAMDAWKANKEEIAKLDAKVEQFTNNADKLDYSIAVASGIIAGLIDSFFVGELSFELAQDSKWGDEKVSDFVKKVAEKKGWDPKKSNGSLQSAVKYLEDKYPIAADGATDLFGGGRQHHLRDFSHHPNPLGLLFSILTQFTGKVFGTNKEGMFIVDQAPDTTYIGNDLKSKLSLGITNWIFHMISDLAGSSGTISRGNYGSGLPGPLLSFLKMASSLPFFKNKDNVNHLSLWCSKLYNGTLFAEHDATGKIIRETAIGFDFRTEMGVAHEYITGGQLKKQAIPVIVNECIVRGFYFARHLYEELKTHEIKQFKDLSGLNFKKIIPFNNRTIARMLTISTGTMVAIDMADAAIRSGVKNGFNVYNPKLYVDFVLHLNFVGIGRCAVAIGTDIVMGVKLTHVESERLQMMAVQPCFNNVVLYYKNAHMWESAWNASEEMLKSYILSCASLLKAQENFEIACGALDDASCTMRDIANNNPIATQRFKKSLNKVR